MMAQAILTVKTSTSFQSQIFKMIEVEKHIGIEEQLQGIVDNSPKNAVMHFIPDHLSFGCAEGVELFETYRFPIQTFSIIRP